MIGVIDQHKFVGFEVVGERVSSPDDVHVGRWKEWIDGDSHGIFEHIGYDFGEDCSIDGDAWIGVGLDEIRFEFLIDHEI